jgi:hypothetical protein
MTVDVLVKGLIGEHVHHLLGVLRAQRRKDQPLADQARVVWEGGHVGATSAGYGHAQGCRRGLIDEETEYVNRRIMTLVVVALVLVIGVFVYARVHRSTFQTTCEKSGGRVITEFTANGPREVCVPKDRGGGTGRGSDADDPG